GPLPARAHRGGTGAAAPCLFDAEGSRDRRPPGRVAVAPRRQGGGPALFPRGPGTGSRQPIAATCAAQDRGAGRGRRMNLSRLLALAGLLVLAGCATTLPVAQLPPEQHAAAVQRQVAREQALAEASSWSLS